VKNKKLITIGLIIGLSILYLWRKNQTAAAADPTDVYSGPGGTISPSGSPGGW
jgi:hypothetical protein